MILSIFNFKSLSLYLKSFKGVFIALVLILMSELTVMVLVKNARKEAAANSLLELNYLKEDVGQKYVIGYKNYVFFNRKAEFIQIGDSSGFYGVKPNTINQYLHGMHYINTNCCADTGWNGYRYTAEHFLRKNKKAKFLILHITPYSLPGQFKDGFSSHLYDVISSFWRGFYTLPSICFRKKITEFIYRKQGQDIGKDFITRFMGEYAPKNMNYIKFLSDNNGWMPYNRKTPSWEQMPLGKCGPGIIENFSDTKNHVSMIDHMKKIKELADEYNTKMIVIFNPVACHASEEIKPIVDEIEKFKKENPDVFIPFDFIRTWEKNDFSDQWHLTPEAAERHSQLIGEALKKYLHSGPN